VTHLKLTIAYDGTGLVGWQRQAAGISVQQLLEEALLPLDPSGPAVTAAGRTDAGVHALGQVASVTLQREIAADAVVRAINMRLPPSVRVLAAEHVRPEFHARFLAVAKTYRYRIWNAEVLSPFERPYVWHIPGPPLDVAAMSDAAARFAGTHDFAAFQGTGSDVETTVRTIFSSKVIATADPIRDGLISYEVRGDGFLRHMVRAVAGTLVEVGRGRAAPAWIEEVLASRSRTAAGRTAPAAGLFLVSVEYEGYEGYDG
jgi:tRNA pseudouridine38-40 synthase